MPKPYPKEVRVDVVAVARRRDPKTTLKQTATDFGISESCLTNWLAKADREDGIPFRSNECGARGPPQGSAYLSRRICRENDL